MTEFEALRMDNKYARWGESKKALPDEMLDKMDECSRSVFLTEQALRLHKAKIESLLLDYNNFAQDMMGMMMFCEREEYFTPHGILKMKENTLVFEKEKENVRTTALNSEASSNESSDQTANINSGDLTGPSH